jgi:hypothetical protein
MTRRAWLLAAMMVVVAVERLFSATTAQSRTRPPGR